MLYLENDNILNTQIQYKEGVINMLKYGVFLARFQPLHHGHLYMIEKALKENDRVLVVLGSENKNGMIRNPFSIELRKEWLYNSLSDKSYKDRCDVITLPDWSTETDDKQLSQWGHYLYYNIVANIGQKKFAIYYNDSIDIIKSWFDDEIKDNIEIRHSERAAIFDTLSATKIRQAILDDNMKYLMDHLPLPVLKDLKFMKDVLSSIRENPKEDFSMI